MITREQIENYCSYNHELPFSRLLFATLDRDYRVKNKKYIIPTRTIVQVRLYVYAPADLVVNNKCVTKQFPYDAATLLEDE